MHVLELKDVSHHILNLRFSLIHILHQTMRTNTLIFMLTTRKLKLKLWIAFIIRSF